MLLCVRAVISLHGRCGPSVFIMRCMDGGFSNNSPFSHRELCASRLSFLMREQIFFLLPKSHLGGRVKVPPPHKAWELFEAGEKDAVMLMEKIKNDGFTLKPKTVDTDGRSPTGTRFPMQAVLQSQKQAPSS